MRTPPEGLHPANAKPDFLAAEGLGAFVLLTTSLLFSPFHSL